MKVIVVSGPTASGKTSISIDLAKKFGGEIVNFDSLLLYKELVIGTAKPTVEEMSGVPHHMVDVRSIAEPMNAADYFRDARPLVEKLLADGKIVYLVGGSGFYLQALLKGMYSSESTPDEVSRKSDELYEKEGIAPFIQFLKEFDVPSFERYHENDHYRIRRAVEHFWTTNTPLSVVRAKKEELNASLDSESIHPWDVLHIYLDPPKEEHLEIIKKRTEKMLQDGMIDEVKSLLAQGFTGQEKPLQSIGYLEIFQYLDNKFSSEAAFRERIMISTRQLAKAQRTWFNKEKHKLSFNPITQREDIFKEVRTFLDKKKPL